MSIDARHQQPLTIAVTASTPGQGAKAEHLYRLALDLFHDRELGTQDVLVNRICYAATDGTLLVLATVTDLATGLFVQFTGAPGAALPFVTYGKKFLQETKNPQLNNTALKLWR